MSPSRSAFPTTHPSLLDGVQTRCRVAWEAFFHRYQPLIRRWCARHGLPADACDDIAQDLILTLPRKLAAYQREADDGGVNRFRSWLRAVVRHAVIDHARLRLRKAGDFGVGGEDDPLWDLPAADDLEAELSESHRRDVEAVVSAVRATVEPATWDVFEQVKLRDVSPAVAAERVGKTAAAVYMAVHRVNRLLRAEYRRLLNPCGVEEENSDDFVSHSCRPAESP